MKLSIKATMLSSALTALIMVLLSLPIHLMRWQWMGGMEHGAGTWLPGHPWGHGMMMQQAQMGGWPVIAWILLAIAVLMVYAGLTGAIFAAIYNAFAPKQQP